MNYSIVLLDASQTDNTTVRESVTCTKKIFQKLREVTLDFLQNSYGSNHSIRISKAPSLSFKETYRKIFQRYLKKFLKNLCPNFQRSIQDFSQNNLAQIHLFFLTISSNLPNPKEFFFLHMNGKYYYRKLCLASNLHVTQLLMNLVEQTLYSLVQPIEIVAGLGIER